MASIINRDGRWRALVRRRGFKSQCKTFPTKAQAQAWARQVESDMDAGNVSATLGALTIADVIKAYRNLRDKARPISDSSNEHYMLKALERGLGHHRLAAVQPDALVDYATMRREEGARPCGSRACIALRRPLRIASSLRARDSSCRVDGGLQGIADLVRFGYFLLGVFLGPASLAQPPNCSRS